MNDLDDWLKRASATTKLDGNDRATDALLQRLSLDPPPSQWAGKREFRRALACAALSAVLTCGGVGSAFFVTQAPSRPTWVAAPASMSPYALLVER
ncbi:hypothetical protein D5301_21745 [Stenotrophomonas sp. MH181796]|nr:hypothetical protein [Stenotrophomonas sp. MH181796]